MGSERKAKILFVVMDFWQAGAERFTFEVDSCLNTSLFDVEILSLRDLNMSSNFEDYYYAKHISLGRKIHFLNDLIYSNPIFKRISAKSSLFRQFSQNINHKVTSRRVNEFLEKFDVISWHGEYTFVHLSKFVTENILDKSVIHLMNARFQGAHVYDLYPKNRHYIFTSGFDDEEQVKYELTEFPWYTYFLFSLYLKINRRANSWQFSEENKTKRIGIFTRLDAMKPLDPFFYAFHLLSDYLPNTQLYIYGTGDPELSGSRRYTRHLEIDDRVFFKGHQEDIVQTAIDDKLDLVWFQGYKNRPGGYAGFDICMSGVPQLFWEFTYASTELNDSGVYPIYRNLNLFVDHSRKILTDKKLASELSAAQFNDLLENRDMEKKIVILEKLFLKIANGKLNELKNRSGVEIVVDEEL